MTCTRPQAESQNPLTRGRRPHMTDAVEKGLRTSPNSDSADSEDDLGGGCDDGAADWRPSKSVL